LDPLFFPHTFNAFCFPRPTPFPPMIIDPRRFPFFLRLFRDLAHSRGQPCPSLFFHNRRLNPPHSFCFGPSAISFLNGFPDPSLQPEWCYVLRSPVSPLYFSPRRPGFMVVYAFHLPFIGFWTWGRLPRASLPEPFFFVYLRWIGRWVSRALHGNRFPPKFLSQTQIGGLTPNCVTSPNDAVSAQIWN